MKKTITLLMLTLFMSVFAFAQKRERPMPELRKIPVKQQNLASMLPKKNPLMDISKAPFKILKKDSMTPFTVPATTPSKAPRKAPRKAPEDDSNFFSFDDETLRPWTTIDADGDGFDWYIPIDAFKGRDGTGGTLATSESYSNEYGKALTPDNYLVSPKIALDGSITFYAKGQDASYAREHFGVAVSTSGNTDASDFTTIAEWTATEDWVEYTVDLSDYAGQEGYVAIRHFGVTDEFILDVDDITLYTSKLTIPEYSEWLFSAKDVSEDPEGNDYSSPVYVSFFGDKVFIRGICSYLPDAEIVGTRSGNQIVFDSGQYLGKFWDYELYFVGINNETGKVEDVTMTINADENRLTTDTWIATTDEEYFFEQYANVVILKPVEKAATPETPTINNVGEYGSFTYMHATIPLIDTEGNPLIANNMSYQIYYEKNNVQQSYVLKAGKGYYESLTEDMTIIPYSFTDNLDIFPGSPHEIYLYADDLADWDKVGIKTIYTVAGETHESEIFWYAFPHTVTIDETTGGTVKVSKNFCQEGETVTLTVTPDEGYELESLTVKDGAEAEVTVGEDNTFTMPATDVTVTATFKKLPVDVNITVESGKDITDAIAAAADGAPVKNLTITLEENGEYPVSAPLEAGGNIIINGAEGAVIDASSNSGAFIQMSATPMVEANSKSTYIIDNVTIKDVTIKGVKSSLFWDNKVKYGIAAFTIDNAVIELTTETLKNDAVISFQGGGIKDFSITNSTVYGNAVGTYFLRYNGNNGRIDNLGYDKNVDTQSWTYENNTFYKVLKSNGQWGNGPAGQAYFVYSVKNNIWYDSSKEIARRLLNGQLGGQSKVTFENNTYFNDGADVSESQTNYDKSGTALTSDSEFADADAGDFTIGESTEQAELQTGDPRWLVDFVGGEVDNSALLAEITEAGKLLRRHREYYDENNTESPDDAGKVLVDAIRDAESVAESATSQKKIEKALAELIEAEEGYTDALMEYELAESEEILAGADPEEDELAAEIKRLCDLQDIVRADESNQPKNIWNYAELIDDAQVAYLQNAINELLPEARAMDDDAARKAVEKADKALEGVISEILFDALKALREALGIEPTGIRGVEAERSDAPAYNMAGQRVNANTAKGIIIKNGRKYVK